MIETCTKVMRPGEGMILDTASQAIRNPAVPVLPSQVRCFMDCQIRWCTG